MSHNIDKICSLASNVQSVVAQNVLSEKSYAQLHAGLAINGNLEESLWYKLIKGAGSNTAERLARKANCEKQYRLLLKDQRVGVRASLFATGLPGVSDELALEAVSKKWFDSTYARIWLCSEVGVPEVVHRAVALVDNSNALLGVMANTELFSKEEILKKLSSIKYSNYCHEFRALIDTRPYVIPELLLKAARFNQDSLGVLKPIAMSAHCKGAVAQEIIRICDLRAKSMSRACRADILGEIVNNPNTDASVIKMIFALKGNSAPVRSLRTAITSMLPGRQKSGAMVHEWVNANPNERGRINFYLKDEWSRRDNYPSIASWLKDGPAYKKPKNGRASHAQFKIEDVKFSSNWDRANDKVPNVGEVISYYVSEPLDKIGANGWRVFIDLALGWEGNLAELLKTVKFTAV